MACIGVQTAGISIRTFENGKVCGDDLHREHAFCRKAPSDIILAQALHGTIFPRVAADDVRVELATLEKGKREEVAAAGETCEVHDRDGRLALQICRPIPLDRPGTAVAGMTERGWVEASEILEAVLDEIVDFVLVAEADPRGHSIEFWCFHRPTRVKEVMSQGRRT